MNDKIRVRKFRHMTKFNTLLTNWYRNHIVFLHKCDLFLKIMYARHQSKRKMKSIHNENDDDDESRIIFNAHIEISKDFV